MDRRSTTSLPPDLSEMVLDERSARFTDEVRLADVWAVLVRRKFLVATLVVLSVAFGLVHALLTPHVYEYTTMVEVGTRYTVSRNELGGRLELIEPIETVRAKVAGGYVAQALQEHIKETNDQGRYQVDAEVPKNSQVLVLRSKGTAENEAVLVSLHEAIADRIRRDHLQVQKVLRNDLEARLELQQHGLSELRKQAELFDAQLKRLEGKAELPARELSYLTSLRLADNQRAQTETITLIDSVRQQLANMRETKVAVSPMRSLDPVGLGKSTSVMLAALGGLVLGVVVALFVDFVARAREQAPGATPAA